MADWITDDQLYDAADRCAKKLIEMCDASIRNTDHAPHRPVTLPGTIIESLRLDAEDFMFYDPTKLIEEYNRLIDVVQDVGDNVSAVTDIGETRNHLINWTGDAATAFKRQLDMMQEYCELMQTNIMQAMQGLLLADQLAIHARADYLSLLEATIAAAEHEIDEESKRQAVAYISVVQDVIESVLQVDSKSLVTGAVDLTVKIGGTVAQRTIEGGDADIVIDHYVRYRDELRGNYGLALTNLQHRFEERIGDVLRDGQPLKEPLKPYCHVDSPSFKYENFQSTRGGDPGLITPVVEDEREKHVEEMKKKDSGIDRRLNHGDKGAV